MIDEDGLRGITSNPTIFEKAISGSDDYDEALRTLLGSSADTQTILDALVAEDIRNAADLLRPVYDENDGADGFVSIEVSPLLARDSETTLSEARRLWEVVNRPNILIKIPGTPEGLPAVENAISEGINVNVTLLFSLSNYVQVAEAYVQGLERLSQDSVQSLKRTASVASFFVSRVDTAVDKTIEKKLSGASSPSGRDTALLQSLQGKVAIANSKLAYQKYKEIFGGARFRQLEARGARPQRVLWASTGTKNADYSDVLYVESLIGPNTINTMPQATWDAFRDHGHARPTLDAEVEAAGRTIETLEKFEIDLEAITEKLQDDGVQSFSDSFRELMQTIDKKREELLR